MTRIFIDIDGALLDWPPMRSNDYPLRTDVQPQAHTALVEALRGINGMYPIIAWSALGADYAFTWAERFLNHNGIHYQKAIALDPMLLRPGDYYIGPVISEGCGMSADAFVGYAERLRAEWLASHKHFDPEVIE